MTVISSFYGDDHGLKFAHGSVAIGSIIPYRWDFFHSRQPAQSHVHQLFAPHVDTRLRFAPNGGRGQDWG